MRLPVALTSGDPAGVGLELTPKAWKILRDTLPFFVIADRGHLASVTGDGPIVELKRPEDAIHACAEGLPFIHHEFPEPASPGKPCLANAGATVDVLRMAAEMALRRQVSAICTNPVSKHVLWEGARFPYPGQTEFLSTLCGGEEGVMMLASPLLKVVPVTVHVPLKSVATQLTPERIKHVARVCHESLKIDFAVESPRIAFSGLNPHAGESGRMGDEEIRIIAPALTELRGEGIRLSGPHAADSMFRRDALPSYDAAICMYHDQALIPLKALSFHDGTNVTLGLRIVRTSPDHGTAFDIAGKKVASADSLVASLRLAASVAANRRNCN